nr:hypothetical protein [Cryptomonas curvata]
MITLKTKLNILFYKIFLKFYSNMKNKTSEPMSVDLLREEVQLITSIIIFAELKLILSNSYYYSKKINANLLVDTIIKFLVVSSKRKILFRLGLNKHTSLESSNQWIIKKIQIEEYSSILNLLNLIHTLESNPNNSLSLTSSLVENLVIKLSNFMVYEVFSNRNISQLILLKWYTIDYLLFSYNVTNLKTYLYWKSYIEITYSNIKKFSTDTYPLLICTKNGIEAKRLYNRKLIYNMNSSQVQTVLSKILNFIEYILYGTKIGM